ncbi:unnamed protein product [Withania somnifera]
MDKRTGRGKQKIEMKLIESKEAHNVSFSKRKKVCSRKREEYSTITGANVGVTLISPSGRPYTYGSTSIKNIIDKFLELKQDNHQHDHADLGKLTVYEEFEDLRKEVQALNKMYPYSEITLDKHRLEQFVSMKSQLDKFKEERRGKLATQENA